MFQQYHDGEINPARIMNYFTDEEEHREVAALFHTRIEELTSEREKEKALMETVLRIKNHSIETAAEIWSPQIWRDCSV